jgi:hypothetical protein
MYPSDYNDITLFESDLDEVNLKDPDRLYYRIENDIQSLIDTYNIYDSFNPDVDELNEILDKVTRLHEHCRLDVTDEYE